MSRCFPFPPPGYEKKSIPDIANVLKKEKTKEKKHKEKKDKEKREGKDRRDKERSDGKHRENKDKKEKRKDKKKDKEKNREKDQEKGSTLVEKRVSEQSVDYIGAKFNQRESEQVQDKKEKSSISEDKRHIGQFENCNGEKLHQKVERSRDTRNIPEAKTLAVQLQGHSGGAKPVQNSFPNKDSEDSKFMQEFTKRISDDGKGSRSQLVEGFMGNDYTKDERIDENVRDTCMVVDGKEKIKDKRLGNWKMDGQRIQHEEKFNGNGMSHNLPGSIQNKTGVSKPTEKFEERMEGKDKSKQREVDDKQGDKRKSKHKDKQSKGNDKKSEKEKKKEDKAKKEHKKSEKDAIHLPKDSDMNAATEGNLKKRKDIERNGFLHDYVPRPDKMPKLNSYPLSENGKELKPTQTTTVFTPPRQMTVDNFNVDNKDRKINGLTGAHQLPLSAPHQLPISAPKPPPVIAEQIAETSRKSPHPDVKYLSKVLSVPQMDEWPDFDDQAWLFSKKESLPDKAEVDRVGVNQGQQVWAEALMIESPDVFALPYVIPY